MMSKIFLDPTDQQRQTQSSFRALRGIIQSQSQKNDDQHMTGKKENEKLLGRA